MARVVYGISGEGSGHSSRAREVLTHLLSRGHQVRPVSYDRGYRNLASDFNVFETEGLHIASSDNKVSLVRTFTENLARLSSGIRRLRELRHELFEQFQPHVVITDFEPMTAYLAMHHGLPLVSLDNQHRMRYMRYPCPPDLKTEAAVTETVIRALVPRPDVSLVTTFYFGELTNRRTFLFPPILRRSVLETRPRHGEHVLVYFTGGFESFVERLRTFPREHFIVYGQGEVARQEDNLRFEPPSREGFLRDLASCKAVIATAGFTLMTEALHLDKPMLALPMEGQFEQELNALMLDELGCGKNGREPGGGTVGDFLYRLPEYVERLEQRGPSDGNGALFAKLDELLAGDAARAREFRARREANSRPPAPAGDG